MGKRQAPDTQEDLEKRLRGAMTYFNPERSGGFLRKVPSVPIC
jgi:hypothetical protein